MCPNAPGRHFPELFQVVTLTTVAGTDLRSSRRSSRRLKAITRTMASKKWMVTDVRIECCCINSFTSWGLFDWLSLVLLIYFGWGVENLPDNFSQFVDAVRSTRERTFRTNPSGQRQSDWIYEFLRVLGESVDNIDDIKFAGYKVVSGFHPCHHSKNMIYSCCVLLAGRLSMDRLRGRAYPHQLCSNRRYANVYV